VNHRAELDFVKRQLPTPRDGYTQHFYDGISLLKGDGWMEDEEGLNDCGDFNRQAGVWLGQLAKPPTITS
jgi:hypothetical protein